MGKHNERERQRLLVSEIAEWVATKSVDGSSRAEFDQSSEFLRLARELARSVRAGNDTAAELTERFEHLAVEVLARSAHRLEESGTAEADDFTSRSVGPTGHDDSAHSPERALLRLVGAATHVLLDDEARQRREIAGTVDVFARTLSHELKNPIGVAEGAAEMLLDDEVTSDPAQRRRFAQLIVRNLRRANDLVNDLRAIVADRSQDGRTVRSRSLRATAEDALHEVRGAAGERGVALSLIEPFPDVAVDASRVTLVLMNLVWNAVKYSDPGKAGSWVRIGARHTADGWWHCFVSDNGLGIPDGARERVFERAYRAHCDVAGGSGLGLAITRDAIEQLGGRIWLESDEGLGSTFHFTVPALAPSEPAARAPARSGS